MVMKENTNFEGNKLATTMKEVFYTDEKIMAQSDTNEIGKIVEMLIVKID